MKIIKIICYLVEIQYKNIYITATNSTKSGRHVVVQLETDNGLKGWGESGIISARYPSQGDTPETMMDIIRFYLGPLILGMNPLEIGAIIHKMDVSIKGHYFAKSAIDHALYDVAGIHLGVSAATLLGGMINRSFPVSRSLPIGSPTEVSRRAMQLKDEGYQCLTLKCGLDAKNELDCFIQVRKQLGPDFPLEIDPNGGYDKNTAIQIIKKMEDYNLSAVEQPVKGNDLLAMADIRNKTNTMLIADESVFSIDDLKNVIEFKAADTICLKPFKSGGMYTSKKLQHIAEGFNLRISTGSMHPFGIGTAALQQFISTIPDLATAGYGAPGERFVDDIIDEGCFTFKNGVVDLIDKPGLGIKVNLAKLEKYSKKIITIF